MGRKRATIEKQLSFFRTKTLGYFKLKNQSLLYKVRRPQFQDIKFPFQREKVHFGERKYRLGGF